MVVKDGYLPVSGKIVGEELAKLPVRSAPRRRIGPGGDLVRCRALRRSEPAEEDHGRDRTDPGPPGHRRRSAARQRHTVAATSAPQALDRSRRAVGGDRRRHSAIIASILGILVFILLEVIPLTRPAARHGRAVACRSTGRSRRCWSTSTRAHVAVLAREARCACCVSPTARWSPSARSRRLLRRPPRPPRRPPIRCPGRQPAPHRRRRRRWSRPRSRPAARRSPRPPPTAG